MRPEELRKSLDFDDILLLPTDKSEITSRKTVDTSTKISRNLILKYPLIASPMDTISDVETCIALNSIGAAGVLHRFMPIGTQVGKAREIKEKSGKCYVAVGLQDYTERIMALSPYADLFMLDSANGSNVLVEDFIRWYKSCGFPQDVVIGNTLTKASVSRAINLGADSVRHGIGIGKACLTTDMTGIGCPPVTALYYGWKAIRNEELENRDIRTNSNLNPPALLLDGGIRKPGDLVKAIVCGADAVICGSIFAGCKETPGQIINGKKLFRGMASRSVVEDYGLWDGNPENLFIEGTELEVPYTGQSVTDVVYHYVNGLRSAMAYLGFANLQEMKSSLWTGECLGVRV